MFHDIATHRRPHLDELAAIWLLRTFGNEAFPGIRNASIQLFDAGAVAPDGKPGDEYERELGVLPIGIWGGRFDEHATADKVRKEGECAATLVAKALGQDQEPALRRILRFVAEGDLQGTGNAFDLKALVDAMNALHPDDPSHAMRFVAAALNALYAKERRFREAIVQYASVSEISEVRRADGSTICLAVLQSDNEAMPAVARSHNGGPPADVVVVRQSSGHTQVLTRRGAPSMRNVVAALREEELRWRELPPQAPDRLCAEGDVAGWYYQQAGEMILNGSLTVVNAPPTILQLGMVVQTVVRTLQM